MSLKKRGAIYSVIALMLCAAVYLNWNYSKNNPDSPDDVTVSTDYTSGAGLLDKSVLVSKNTDQASDYFADARLSRQKARDEAVSILNNTIESLSASENDVAAAGAGIKLLAESSVIESRIESLVIAKGYKDCVAYVNENAVNVIIAKTSSGISDADIAKIRDIVIDEANVTADKIKIIETE